MKNYIIIPTYKEAENLKDLLPLLVKYNVIVVDDHSLDGTDRICRKYKNVRLITRKDKRGLSSAVLDGILSIKDRDAKIVVMDADFQHDPAKIPEFLEKLKKFDVVYGHREEAQMGLSRNIISKVASVLAKSMINGIKDIKDPMSGYFAFKKSSIDIEKIKPIGYKIMLDVMASMKEGGKIGEVNFKFGDRKNGKSKLTNRVMLDFILQLMELNNFRFLKFALVGLSGIVVNEFFAFVFHTFLPLYLVFIASAEISILSNFILNHKITFESRVSIRQALPRYNLIALVGLVINVSTALYLSIFVYYLLANLIGIIIAFVFNYILSEKYAWKSYEND